jgi:hypothetical protein
MVYTCADANSQTHTFTLFACSVARHTDHLTVTETANVYSSQSSNDWQWEMVGSLQFKIMLQRTCCTYACVSCCNTHTRYISRGKKIDSDAGIVFSLEQRVFRCRAHANELLETFQIHRPCCTAKSSTNGFLWGGKPEHMRPTTAGRVYRACDKFIGKGRSNLGKSYNARASRKVRRKASSCYMYI